MSIRIRLVLCLLLSSNLNLYPAIVITGDTTNSQTTSFPIGTNAFDIFGGPLQQPTMYIGAGVVNAGNQYAIARVNNYTNSLQALAPSTLDLNNVAGQTNPLCGAKINFLKLNNDKPVVLIDGSFNIYKYTNVMDKLSVVSAGPVNDTTGAQAGALLNLAVANGSLSQSFVACTPNSNLNFGTTGSGIALFEYLGTSFVAQNNNQACALDNNSSQIGINNSVTLTNAIDLHWSGELGCLFVALSAQAGSTSGNGARSIVVGKVAKATGQSYDTINFEEFVPSAAIAGNNQIIGTLTSNATVTALKLKTMYTSTKLNYLIVVGGNDVASNVGNQVYALPLVSATGTNIGQLAKYDQTPTNIYKNNFFVGRTLDTPATTSSDLLTSSDSAAIVGSGNLPLNASETITDLFISGDSVYASVGTTTASNATGIWHSQAILDQNGLIANWTTWELVGGNPAPIFGSAINAVDGSYWYLTGSDASHVNTINKTIWGNGSQDGLLGGTSSDASLGLVDNLSTLFPASTGGLFNLINIPASNPALNGITLLLATGAKQIAIINPDAAVAGDFSTGLVASSNDTYPTTTSSSTIASITGHNLTTTSALTSATLATNSLPMSWLIASGSQGVTILRKSNGEGWTTPLTSLGDLNTSYKFELFGNYQFVQKITSDQDYLYILTTTTLDRVPLNSANLASGTPTVTTIAQVGNLVGTISTDVLNDLIVSGDLAILATSAGLFRVANGSSIQDPSVSWTSVTVPEQLCVPCTKLVCVAPGENSPTSLTDGGNLYAVSSYRGLHQTIINRFYVKLAGAIDDQTILPLPDLYVKNNLSYFINFESFRDNFFTDGTLLMNSLSQDVNQNSFVNIMKPGINSGNSTAQTNPPYNISLTAINEANLVSNLLRSTNAGALLISGEFGIQVNE